MADNVTVPLTGTGDATADIRTDDVGGVMYPVSKLDAGGDGVSVPVVAGQQTMAASLPVVVASNQTAIPVTATLTSTTITGNVTVVQPTGTNLHVVTDSGTITTVGAVTAITNALPAGTNAIGKLAANSGVDIGDVDVASVSGNVTVIQGTATNLKTQAEAYQGGAAVAAGNPLQVSLANTGANGTPIVVSGTVTASGGATAANQTTQITAEQAIQASVELLDNAVSGAGFNITQFAGTNAVVGSGTATGALRVELPTNGTGVIATVGAVTAITNALPAGSAIIGKVGIDQTTPGTTNLVALAANQSVNVAQINGVTPLMGAGNTGTGSERVTIATDDINLAAINAVSGTTAGAAVVTDANGTIQQYLRGLIKLAITTTNYPERQFLGTAQTVINTATDIAAANFSGAPSATYDSSGDAAVPSPRYALAVLQCPDWAAAPVLGTTIDLYALFPDVDSTSDETDAPSGTSQGGAHYLGSFVVAAADALQRRAITIDLLGFTKADFYIKNSTAQNMNNDGGTNCVLKVTPLSVGIVG